MAEHPMQCYPGQFEPWTPGISVIPQDMPAEDWGIYGDRAHICLKSRVVMVSDEAISRAMSGQITSSTGDKP